MNKDEFKACIARMADREVFTLPDLVEQSGQADEYNRSPKGEGKRFWTQVENGEFNTGRFEICPLDTKKGNAQKYQKRILEQPIIAPNSDMTIRFANELLLPLGKTLAIIPLRKKAEAVA
jgi:hypothetical protein